MSRAARWLCALLLSVGVLGHAHASDIEVTLLGTGTPRPDIQRFGPATLVEAGGRYFVFDAGRGLTIRLQQAGIALQQIERVFLTHLHSDHVSGLSDLWLTGWIWQREHALELYGPVGVKRLAASLQRAHAADIAYRVSDTGLDRRTAGLHATEARADGVLYERDGVRVIAFKVDHGVVKPAYGYRLEYGGRSVVISGDTTYSRTLVRHAQAADLLVHEIAAADEGLLQRNPRLQKVMAYHTRPEQMLQILNETKPRAAVLTHVLLFGVDEAQLMHELRQADAGNLYLGEDLLRIGIGEEIRVRRP